MSNGVSLFMPTVQGTVLNSVVDYDSEAFHHWVLLYLLLSICSGLIGGMQSLCFSVVGRRLSNSVRKKLFKGIIVQDVAFFDGNSSGDLTSRLTNDVWFMVSPMQSMLGSLLSNSILLIGGIAWCFSTSWRLSMLAFTTVGPIIHITQIYASWSKNLNSEIYGAMAVANSQATEALGNVRTVKSFATERYEQRKYDDANDVALMKGIRDALGGAGMYTINSYLELGSAVLILWYKFLQYFRSVNYR
jgi:ABC-type multidrug transport system fused ATPase/permease subunit